MKEEKVIVRGDRSGVFFGVISKREGKEVTISNCRCLWFWSGAASLMQLAVDGVANPQNCKFTKIVSEVTILDAIEIIPCTPKAVKSIENTPIWSILNDE